ncbi:ABC transporter ATP-binding protein [Sedimentibacter hydroxybenzoicus DSM 7310]|uniref:ABC transporter ATP-binding protein n=1 Tax=Sedimentibacter hydroxybenzoicus DSM 7310 TaxID=1123245 RepID=A0A974BM67_SEDHY|nr:ABC transporter ATP-binding protein [Sedimentibacter hydroxybenzoicus]NYB75960.1 ABC transporter ATP-binding protein [Sedimentibacter hydroxybenzoicus DSM 7310]
MNQEKMSYFKVATRILAASFKAAPLWIIADSMGMILSSSSYVLIVHALQNMFDTITHAIQNGANFTSLLITIFITVAVLIFNELMNAVCNFLAGPTALRIRGAYREKIHKKVSKLTALDFENAETLDCIQKAKEGADNGIQLYHSVSTLLTFYGPYFVIMAIYFYNLRPVLVWSIFLMFVPLLISQIVKEKVYTKLIDESAPIERKVNYYENEMYKKEYIKETRLLGIYSFIRSKYEKELKLFCSKRWDSVKKVQMIEIGLRALTLMGYFGVIVLFVSSLINGYITIGAFAAVFSSVNIMISFMDDAVSNYLGDMLGIYGSLRSLVHFLDLPEEDGVDDDINYSEGINISNVSFKYPNSNIYALENISLHISDGETIAVVGENGAGKTTLVKIISGILMPTSGDILINDASISSYSKKSRFKYVSGIVQKFGKYKMLLKDNVHLSYPDNPIDEEKVKLALYSADFNLDSEKITSGLSTMLSRDFGGLDLSGGEWQRIALARGIYKNSKFIILDEPTSAIDPIEESLIYKKFRDIAKDKIAIIVTHRLGATQIADRIVVLDNGKIVETGTHEQLLNSGGKYSVMFKTQAKWYSDMKT